MPQRLVRMVPPPAGSAYNPFTTNERTYGGSAPIDMIERDAELAMQHGWTRLGMVGTTAQRPTPQDTDFATGIPAGFRFADLTISTSIIYDDASKLWRHAVSGAAV